MKKFRLVIISFVLVLTLFMGVVSVSASDKTFKYEEQVKKLFFEKYSYIPEDNWNVYREYYEFFTPESTAPDFVLVGAYVTMGEMDCVEVIGDYVLVLDSTYFPNKSVYFVYIPLENSLYTLTELFNADSKRFEMLFANRGVGLELIGDTDQDRKITIKDATWLQKKLAGYSMSTYYGEDTCVLEERYVQDFNRDTVVNIQDVTAIQKYLAGVTGAYAENVKDPVDNPFSSAVRQDAEYEDDCIIVVVKYGWGHDYTLEDFPEDEFSSVDKIGGDYNEGYAFYKLYLKTPGRENVVEAIKALDYRAETDLEAVEPNYIYYIDEWI